MEYKDRRRKVDWKKVGKGILMGLGGLLVVVLIFYIAHLATSIAKDEVLTWVETELTEVSKVTTLPSVTPTPTEKVEVEEAVGIEAEEEIVETVSNTGDASGYPNLLTPDYSRQPVFPDVAFGDRPALVAYESPFEDGDYFEDSKGDVDLPQFYYRVMTAGTIKIQQLGVSCVSTETKGCLVILINHFGPTSMFRNAVVDNGFTIAGRVWDMSSPELVTLAGQALVDHYVGRMTVEPDGANCGTIDACESVEWHVVVVGNGESQAHWQGEYLR
jgi:hypothetical protein